MEHEELYQNTQNNGGTTEEYTGVAGEDIYPVAGWPLPILLKIDDHSPGFLSAIIRKPSSFRQAMFAAIACGVVKRPDRFVERATGNRSAEPPWERSLADLGQCVRRMSPEDIINAAFGDPPPGFLPALSRIGHEPLRHPDSYLRLHNLFADPSRRRRRKTLQRIRRVSDDTIDVVEHLHPALLHPNIASRVEDAEDAIRVNDVYRVIIECNSAIAPRALWQSAGDLGQKTTLSEWLRRMLLKADRFPELPLGNGDAELIPVRSGAALEDAGRRFRNCLSSKIVHVLSGRMAFYEFLPQPGALASFYRLNDGWLMAKVYGHCNCPVPPQLDTRVRESVVRLGGRCLMPARCERRFVAADHLVNWRDLGGLMPDIIDDLDVL